MITNDKKGQLPNSLESPFLEPEILDAEPQLELVPRIISLVEESPYDKVSIHSSETEANEEFEEEFAHDDTEVEEISIEGEEKTDAYEYRAEINGEAETEFASDEPEVEEISVEEEETEDPDDRFGISDEAEAAPNIEQIIAGPKPKSPTPA